MDINNIYFGDFFQLIKNIPDKSVDLCIIDPPYDFGTGGIKTGLFKNRESSGTYQDIHDNKLGEGVDIPCMLDEYMRVLKYINIYIWCNKEQIYDYLTYFKNLTGRDINFEIIIFGKTNPPPFTGGHYLKDKEYCLYFWESGKVKIKGKYDTLKTVYLQTLNVADKADFIHPTCKPTNILENLILNSSEPGDTVLDGMAGSGSTLISAKRTGRNYLGFESNEKCYNIAKDRLEGINARGELNLFDINYD